MSLEKDTLPPELSIWQNLRYIQKKTSNEYQAECPRCGDAGHDSKTGSPDRFFMTAGPMARGKCRRCGYFSFADAGKRLTSEEIEESKRRRAEEFRERRRNATGLLEKLRASELVQAYIGNVGPDQVRWWERQGIPRQWQLWYSLGYCPGKRFSHSGKSFVCPAYTIPVYDSDGLLVNIQYRLVGAPKDSGKYRQVYGVPPSAFVANQPAGFSGRNVIVVEGSKKAIVVYIYASLGGEKRDIQVVGIAGDRSWAGLEDYLSLAKRVYIALDPRSERWTKKYCGLVGKNALPVFLPGKPDDMILSGREQELRECFARARNGSA